jgi:hypothetical protein
MIAAAAVAEQLSDGFADVHAWAWDILQPKRNRPLAIEQRLSLPERAVFRIETGSRNYRLTCWSRGWESTFRRHRSLSGIFRQYAPQLVASSALYNALLVEEPQGLPLNAVDDPKVWRQAGSQLAELQQTLMRHRADLLGFGCPLLNVDVMLENLGPLLDYAEFPQAAEFQCAARRALQELSSMHMSDSLVPRLCPRRIVWTGERAIFNGLTSGLVSHPFLAEEYLRLSDCQISAESSLVCEMHHGYYEAWMNRIHSRTLEHAKPLIRFVVPLATAIRIWLRSRGSEALSEEDRMRVSGMLARAERQLHALDGGRRHEAVDVRSRPTPAGRWHDPRSQWARRLMIRIKREQRITDRAGRKEVQP